VGSVNLIVFVTPFLAQPKSDLFLEKLFTAFNYLGGVMHLSVVSSCSVDIVEML
jgi:hypothetical protein